jgi:hypothetical protein
VKEETEFRTIVEERVRADMEPQIQAEIERRLEAVNAAMDGGKKRAEAATPRQPRAPRADKGMPRGKRSTAPPPAPPEPEPETLTGELPEMSEHIPPHNGF